MPEEGLNSSRHSTSLSLFSANASREPDGSFTYFTSSPRLVLVYAEAVVSKIATKTHFARGPDQISTTFEQHNGWPTKQLQYQ